MGGKWTPELPSLTTCERTHMQRPRGIALTPRMGC